MKGPHCTEFLQWSLPRLRLRWAGFRNVRKQVCKRLSRRIEELGFPDFSVYRGYLERAPEEWQILDSLCRITISRFYRDRGVFDILSSRLLPTLARRVFVGRGQELRCWSVGCCSGEEAITLQILWKLRVLPALHEDLPLRIIATDVNHEVLKRAQQGSYPESSLRDFPSELIQKAFTQSGKFYIIKKPFIEDIEFSEQDIRVQLPDGFFHLILCRNVVFTYFEEALQREVLDRILEKLHNRGILIIGIHEALPEGVVGVVPCGDAPGNYEKTDECNELHPA